MSQITSSYVFLANGAYEYTLDMELASKIPQDSLLQRMIDPQQPMMTKDEHGRFLLTLQHPIQLGFIFDLLTTGKLAILGLFDWKTGTDFL